MRKILLGVAFILGLLVGLFSYALYDAVTSETTLEITQGMPISDYREFHASEARTETIASQLDAPWAFTFLPNKDILVTERFGTLKKITPNQTHIIQGVPKVFSQGQGGLLDVTIHPEFENNSYIYLSYAAGTQEGNKLTILRGILNDTQLTETEILFEVAQTKSGSQHFGSQFLWLEDNTLLFSVGDGGNPPTEYNGELIREQAQYLNSHLGKILRIHDDGSIPQDNPFYGRPDVEQEIYSYGHRNIQGLTYDSDRNRILASEHGSKGGDELNNIIPGANYGWPKISYSTEYDTAGTPISTQQNREEFIQPLAVWTPTIAPSELVYYTGNITEWSGDIFLAAMLLREDNSLAAYASSPAGAILRLHVDDSGDIMYQELLSIGDVRVRSIEQGPDGSLYVLTDKTGRQNRPGDFAGHIVKITE